MVATPGTGDTADPVRVVTELPQLSTSYTLISEPNLGEQMTRHGLIVSDTVTIPYYYLSPEIMEEYWGDPEMDVYDTL